MIVDELECSIHTLATMEILKIFLGRPNSKLSQLIATTHESRLLSVDKIMRDEIWFMEGTVKSDDRCSSLYSLSDFEDIKENNIDIAYLEGRYGAIPYPTILNREED